MEIYQGKSVLGKIAIGKLYIYQKEDLRVKRRKVEDVDRELKRFYEGCAITSAELGILYEKALRDVGESGADIFEVHRMMLEDPDYMESIENMIRTQEVNAEFAVAQTSKNFQMIFSSMEDEYMRGRAADIRDVSERLIAVLGDADRGGFAADEPVIIVADDLAPSETVQLDKDKILAFVTLHGSVNSHTAILARTMNIPALVGTDMRLDKGDEGKLAVVDGYEGRIYVEPDEKTLAAKTARQKQDQQQRQLLKTLKGLDNVTLDGQKIMVYANIGDIKDLGAVLKNDAGGIGLFRSEFMYLEKDTFPTEEEQFAVYRSVAEAMAGKRVIIRTLDIGADKQAPYWSLGREENPALGLRGIRLCLEHPDIFKTQLRAIFRASAYGKVAVMYPMIASVEEVVRIKEMARQVRGELEGQGIPIGNVEQGIMIETPAAAMISDLLAREVDFFSIGTNDLTQYTLAIDRQNEKLDPYYDPRHRAVLRMIAMVVKNSHEAGIWTGICGELGADTELAPLFLAMGVDELSVSPGSILPLRRQIRETDVSACREALLGKFL